MIYSFAVLVILYFLTPAGNNPVQDYISEQDDDARARIRWAIATLAEEIPQVSSVSIKALVDGAWELRVQDERSRHHRLVYLAQGGSLLFLSAFTKKTRKTPQAEIALVRARLRKVLSAK